jgi:dipicolinate synthase subunit A
MRTDKLFVVFGSDSRFEYTLKALERNGHEAVSFRDIPMLDFSTLRGRDKALVLPLPFSRDGKSVNLPALPYAVTLNGITGSLKNGDIVFGGMLTEDFIKTCKAKGANVYNYYDKAMILRNAELTADALLMLIDELFLDKNNLKFAITGFGRTAKAIAKVFSDKGLDFVITARSESAENAAKSMNFEFVKLESFTEKSAFFDVIINTVPALIFDGRRLSALRKGSTLIDIASAPFGVTEQDADAHGIRLIRALGLPGKYLPEKAGKLIAERIEFYLKGR